MKRTHRTERIASLQRGWGHLVHVEPSADNRSCYLILEYNSHIGEGSSRSIAMGDAIVSKTEISEHPATALSPDGRQLAVAKQIRTFGRVVHEISINGELRWTMPYDTVHHVCWIDDDRLVWDAWNTEELTASLRDRKAKMGDPADRPPSPIRIFVNGESDGHGVTHFTRLHISGRLWAAEVAENGKIYTVFDDGTCSEKRDIDPDSSAGSPRAVGFRFANDPDVLHGRVTAEKDDKHGAERARHRDLVSKHRFEDIGARYSHDGIEDVDIRSHRAAYVGMRRVGVMAKMANAFGRHMQLKEQRALAKTMCDNAESFLAENGVGLSLTREVSEVRDSIDLLRNARRRKDVKGMEAGYRRLSEAVGEIDRDASWRIYDEKKKKEDNILRQPLMFAFAMLANPYFGPLHIAHESSIRYFPAVLGPGEDRVWTKGYHWVKAVRLLPDGAVAVAAPSGNAFHVVIDEEEGPAFDRIENLRVGSDGVLSYCAVKGEDVYRVTVE